MLKFKRWVCRIIAQTKSNEIKSNQMSLNAFIWAAGRLYLISNLLFSECHSVNAATGIFRASKDLDLEVPRAKRSQNPLGAQCRYVTFVREPNSMSAEVSKSKSPNIPSWFYKLCLFATSLNVLTSMDTFWISSASSFFFFSLSLRSRNCHDARDRSDRACLLTRRLTLFIAALFLTSQSDNWSTCFFFKTANWQSAAIHRR